MGRIVITVLIIITIVIHNIIFMIGIIGRRGHGQQLQNKNRIIFLIIIVIIITTIIIIIRNTMIVLKLIIIDKPNKVVQTHKRCKRISNFQFNKKRHDFSRKQFGKNASQLQTSEAATKRLKFSSLQWIVSFRQSNNLFKMNKAAKKEPEYSPMTKPHRH